MTLEIEWKRYRGAQEELPGDAFWHAYWERFIPLNQTVDDALSFLYFLASGEQWQPSDPANPSLGEAVSRYDTIQNMIFPGETRAEVSPEDDQRFVEPLVVDQFYTASPRLVNLAYLDKEHPLYPHFELLQAQFREPSNR